MLGLFVARGATVLSISTHEVGALVPRSVGRLKLALTRYAARRADEVVTTSEAVPLLPKRRYHLLTTAARDSMRTAASELIGIYQLARASYAAR